MQALDGFPGDACLHDGLGLQHKAIRGDRLLQVFLDSLFFPGVGAGGRLVFCIRHHPVAALLLGVVHGGAR